MLTENKSLIGIDFFTKDKLKQTESIRSDLSNWVSRAKDKTPYDRSFPRKNTSKAYLDQKLNKNGDEDEASQQMLLAEKYNRTDPMAIKKQIGYHQSHSLSNNREPLYQERHCNDLLHRQVSTHQIHFPIKEFGCPNHKTCEDYCSYNKKKNSQYHDSQTKFWGHDANKYNHSIEISENSDNEITRTSVNDKLQYGNSNIKRIFNEKLKLYHPNIVYNMQDIHNRASDMKIFADQNYGFYEPKEGQDQFSNEHSITRHYSESLNSAKQNQAIYKHNVPCRSATCDYQHNTYSYNKQAKLNQIDNIFDIFVPAMRTTIVSPEFVIKLINVHKNNKRIEDPDFIDSKPYIQYVDTEGLTREYIQQENNTLILDDLMEHFWGLHESFIKFAYCHHRFQSLAQEDQKKLLDRNSLLFIMVSN